MRGYKVTKDGLIDEVYELAPEGSRDKYDGAEGVYTESAINKLIAQNVRYREFIGLKAENKRLTVELQDAQEELSRLIGGVKESKERISQLEEDVRGYKGKLSKVQGELVGIKREIDELIGGAY